MADRSHAHALAFLVLAVLMPQMASPGKLPRFTMGPRTNKQLRDFFKNHGSDMADLVPSGQGGHEQGGGSSSNGQSQQGGGDSGGGGGGGNQAPATNAGMYVFSYGIGTPPQQVSGALDISSDLVWTACGATAPFNPGGGAANTTGLLGTEAFTFGDTRIDGVVFGCGLKNVGDFSGVSGVIGLGRGNLSLVSQLQVDRFSYHFAPDDSVDTQSFILFGDDATPQTSHTLSTRLLASDANPSLYYVELAGIQVDGKDLAIPSGTFDLRNKDGSGGVFLSITDLVTVLEEAAYKPLRQAVASKIGLPAVNGLGARARPVLHRRVAGQGEGAVHGARLRRRRRHGAGVGELLLHGLDHRAGVPDDPAVVGRRRVGPRQPDPGRHAHDVRHQWLEAGVRVVGAGGRAAAVGVIPTNFVEDEPTSGRAALGVCPATADLAGGIRDPFHVGRGIHVFLNLYLTVTYSLRTT
ncbi:hypothetical protein OsJ_04214 [Oryza sativa Japonica Group]|uniref:Peptidase A1 domain-containing protein n=1 Tax=Oryza sativa subsp. japonica TaxID=39947 RepID=A2ZZZ3_ORYSJ|nr:hypothetical protein OsJ_04214 [Oryza sativa Japonica Group]